MTVACPKCQITSSKVLDSRHKGNGTRRRRECENGHRFSTFEVVVPENIASYIVQVVVEKTTRKVETEVFSTTSVRSGYPKGKKRTVLDPKQQAVLDKLKRKILEKRNERKQTGSTAST